MRVHSLTRDTGGETPAATPPHLHLEAGLRIYWGMVASLGTAAWERWLDTDRVALFIEPDHQVFNFLFFWL